MYLNKRLLLVIFIISASCVAIAGPADNAQRESEALTERIKQGDDDKERWARISLYSDSEAAEDLVMPLVKSADLTMRLDPVRGYLEFSTVGIRKPTPSPLRAIPNVLSAPSTTYE